jgi:hypothetical protein
LAKSLSVSSISQREPTECLGIALQKEKWPRNHFLSHSS